jgi:hypothetical protein
LFPFCLSYPALSLTSNIMHTHVGSCVPSRGPGSSACGSLNCGCEHPYSLLSVLSLSPTLCCEYSFALSLLLCLSTLMLLPCSRRWPQRRLLLRTLLTLVLTFLPELLLMSGGDASCCLSLAYVALAWCELAM